MSIILLPPQYFVVNKAEMTQNRDPNDLFGTINPITITPCDMYGDKLILISKQCSSLLKYTTW